MNPQIIRSTAISFIVFFGVFAGELAVGQPAAQPPADASLPFTGVYRSAAKTSVARDGQSTVPVTEYSDLNALIATLPKDSEIRAKHPALKPAHQSAPGQRFPEEEHNVRIKDCWILVVKYGKSHIQKGKRSGDNDFHLVVGSSPTAIDGQRMNMEVAGLPPNGGPDGEKLLQVRKTFLSMCAHTPPSGKFAPFTPPIHVSIEGSLFFDGEHTADQIAPAYHLKTTWEIHPITKITRL